MEKEELKGNIKVKIHSNVFKGRSQGEIELQIYRLELFILKNET